MNRQHRAMVCAARALISCRDRVAASFGCCFNGQVLSLAFAGWLLLVVSGWADDGMIALTNARVMTMTDSGTFERGTVLIADRMIVAVGEGIEIPPGARVIDCTGWTITPGLIDARGQLWMESASANQSGGDASLDAFDGIDPSSDDWREVVMAGVTAVYVQPAGGDVSAGVGVVISAAPLADEDEWILQRDAGLQAALGVGNDLSGRGRLRQFERLQRLLADAKKYQEDWAAYREYEQKQQDAARPPEGESAPSDPLPEPGDRRRGSGQTDESNERGEGPVPGRRPARPGGRNPVAGDARPASQQVEPVPPQESPSTEANDEPKAVSPPRQPDFDPVKERLVRVLQGEIPVRLDMRHPDEALRGLALAKEFKLNLVCEGLIGTGSAAADVRTARYPVVLGPWVGNERAAREVERWWREHFRVDAGRLVIASYASSPRGSRWLRAHAATAVAAGLDAKEALAAITVSAAEILGIADRVGTVTPGKRADLAVFGGDPLDISVPVQLTLVGGALVYERGSRSLGESLLMEGSDTAQLPEHWPERFAISSPHVLLPNGQIAPRCLTIERGVITRIAEGLPEEADFPLYQLGHQLVAPGLLLAHTQAGLSSGDYAAFESDSRQLMVVDGFDPTHREVQRLRDEGVLRILLAPPSQLALAGRMAAVRLGSEPEVVSFDAGDKIVLRATARRSDQFPASLLGQVELARGFFAGRRSDTRLYLPIPARSAWLAARQSERPELGAPQRWVLFEVETDAEVRAALDLIEQHRLRAALIGFQGVEPFIDRLLATRTTLIGQPPGESDYAWYLDDLVSAADAGVPILWAAPNARQLRWAVGQAIASGWDAQQALASLTSQGATWLGFDPVHAGLVAGAPADFVLWSGLPTDLRSRPIRITVAGQVVDRGESE